MKNLIKASFLQRIVLPAVLAILLFVVSVFGFVIPAFENNAIEQKRLMLNELTNTAWSILNNYHQEAASGLLSHDEARAKAIAEVEALRYGPDKKDYFWIIDEEPSMVMHPYVHELMGQSLHDYTDLDGKQPFIEAAQIAAQKGEGFINYKWQFKDDKTRIVPKLSFVKAFPEWGWIIGTGIYLDDVQKEISSLTNKLILILLGISLFIALIIVFITYQSLRIENQRREAEQQLHESREKYRSLLESSTEGILLLVGGQIAYSNAFIQSWLQYSDLELETMTVKQLLGNGHEIDFSHTAKETRHEVALRRKDGSTAEAVLTMLPVRFAGKEGLLVTLRDIQEHRAVKSELEDYKHRFEHVSAYSRTGLFRFPLKGRRLTEFNQNVVDLLGYSSKEELMTVPLSHILESKAELRELLAAVRENGIINRKQIKLRKRDGEKLSLNMCLFLVDGKDGAAQYCDGILDPLEAVVVKEDMGRFAENLHRLFAHSNEIIKHFCAPAATCRSDATLEQAVEAMRQDNSTSVLLTVNGKCLGIITHKDIVNRFLGREMPLQSPATDFMTAPVVSADEQMPLAEAGTLMLSKNIAHLLVTNSNGKITGVLEKDKLFGLFVNPVEGLTRVIEGCSCVGDLVRYRSFVPELVKPLATAQANVQTVCGVISAFNDAITNRIIECALKELGPPPVPFSFMVIGSAGRQELIFSSDQDNAIIYANDENGNDEANRQYFLQLGKKICERLGKSGLPMCPGDYMASNPKWCSPVSEWKKYFSDWIVKPDPESILNISVFFDLRHAYGDSSLFNDLYGHVYESLKGKTTFFYLLAQSVAAYKPPLNVFGNIITESSGERETVDIKSCIAQIVMFARIYALRKNIRLGGTIERIKALRAAGVLSKSTADEAVFHFNFLMQQRIERQLEELEKGLAVTNAIVPKKMSEMEQLILKKVFSQMGGYHEKLGAEFMSAYKG